MPQPTGLIAYSNQGQTEIMVANADGTGARRVIDGFVAELSPDSKWLAVARDTNRLHLDLVALDGTVRRQLAGPGEGAMDADWSPDGTHIAFTSKTGTGDPALVIEDIDSGARQTVDTAGWSMPTDGLAFEPAWAPDGIRILIRGIPPQSSHDSRAVFALIDLARKTVRQFTQPRGDGSNGVGDSSWSPDGREIVFTILEGFGLNSLSVVSSSGTREREFGAREDATAAIHFEHGRWSPDSRWIIYSTFQASRDFTTCPCEVHLIGRNGGPIRVITTGRNPTWGRA